MRLTVLNQFAKGLIKSDQQTSLALTENLESTKHYLWHGNTGKAHEQLEDCHLKWPECKEKNEYIVRLLHIIFNYT